jgi:hypothetical protein
MKVISFVTKLAPVSEVIFNTTLVKISTQQPVLIEASGF